MVDGYCMRCKARKLMADPVETRMKNGTPAVTGTCVTCGKKMFKIIRLPPAPGEEKA